MRTRISTRVVVTALLLVLAAAGVAVAAGASSTVNQTIADTDRDNRLDPAPGDAYEQRSELGTRTAARPRRTRTTRARRASPAAAETLANVVMCGQAAAIPREEGS